MSNLVEIKKHLANPAALGQFKLALPAHITPEKFQRVAMTALLNNPDIADCTPGSVMNALMKCAQDGLLPDGREAALVKYSGNAQYMPMVYGLIKRMRNSGEVKAVNAYIVYEQDIFDYEIVNGVESIRHKPAITGNRGEMLLTYAVIMLSDGTPHIEVMMKADVDRARNAGKAANGPAWKNWYEEMAKKTVIHRAAKRVPTSSDAAEFLNSDMRMTLNGGYDDEQDAPAPQNTLVNSINEAIDLEPMKVPEPPVVHPEPAVVYGPPVQDDIFPGDIPSKL